MKQLTKEQAAIIGVFTGVLCGPFSEMHEYIEKLAERSVFNHELADGYFTEALKDLATKDFLKIARQV